MIILLVGLLLGLEGGSIPRWPAPGTMTAPYGLRMRGVRPALHLGVEIAVAVVTLVRVMRGGRVIRAACASGYVLLVVIDHGLQVLSVYGHLSELRVEVGEQVMGQ